MYWNNPIIEYIWPSCHDPVADSLHSGQHCVFYDPAVAKTQIAVNQTLQNLCDWANYNIKNTGVKLFVSNTHNHNRVANLVKVNMWVADLPLQGNVKPMLLQYTGQVPYQSGTGESRLRALERIPQIQTVSAFISTHYKYQQQFAHLESITTFDRFAQICQAEPGQEFLFRTTDQLAPYGLDWYEYNSSRTAQVTPGTDYCVEVMSNYLKQHSDIIFTPEWFDTLTNWHEYKNHLA